MINNRVVIQLMYMIREFANRTEHEHHVEILKELKKELIRLQGADEEAKYFRTLCEAYESKIHLRF